MNSLLWFQRDLRLKDNPALNWVLQQGDPVVAIYIYNPQEDGIWTEGGASRWWLEQSLKKLADDLLTLNIKLQFFKTSAIDTISQLLTDYQINKVAWTNRHEPHRLLYENQIEYRLLNQGIEVKRFKDGLIPQADEFLTATNNTPYRVFTPFYKKLRRELNLSDFYPVKTRQLISPDFTIKPVSNVLTLQQLELSGQHTWHNKLHQHNSPGEQTARKKLQGFIDHTLANYQTERDIPNIDGTSALSPHLHFGEISVQQIITQLIPLIEIQGGAIAAQAEAFLRQLIWREFARYTLWHFPHTASQPMNIKYKKSFWKMDKTKLKKWQQGKTGIPIVDAGMQQLWETGTMHNRVRMLVASLLTKNLGISWQEGASWFWDTLVDADLANNTMGWQWVAGCGVDASPYYRIFNPHTQAQKFDKQGYYINRWSGLTTNTKPASAVVDLSSSRSDALERYKKLVRN